MATGEGDKGRARALGRALAAGGLAALAAGCGDSYGTGPASNQADPVPLKRSLGGRGAADAPPAGGGGGAAASDSIGSGGGITGSGPEDF